MSPLSTLMSQIEEMNKRLEKPAQQAIDKALGEGTWDRAKAEEIEPEQREENWGVGA